MAKSDSAIQLRDSLSLLTRGFYRELIKIAERRLRLEKETAFPVGADLFGFGRKIRHAKPKPLTVRLEPSLGEKLAKSRGKADELEDKLQETRLAFEDKLKTVDRMQKELDRRESVLVRSIREIEVYLRALFYLKQEGDQMRDQLENASAEQNETLGELEDDYKAAEGRKATILRATSSFRTSKCVMENMVAELPKYSTVRDLVEYWLVLETLQDELLKKEEECRRAQEELTIRRKEVEEYRRLLPAVVISKESAILNLKTQLNDLKADIMQLNEQIDVSTVTKVKEDAAWFDVQRWIRKLFLSSIRVKLPGPEEPEASGTLDMLDRIKDFTREALEAVKRLKVEAGNN